MVLYGCESWTVKKAECQRINAFELWCWRRLLRVPWTSRRSNQCILKEIGPEYSLEGMMLKLQYFGHLKQRVDSLERPLSWKDWRWEENWTKENEMIGWHHQLMYMSLSGLWDHKESEMTEQLSWTEENLLVKTRAMKSACWILILALAILIQALWTMFLNFSWLHHFFFLLKIDSLYG